MPNTLTIIFTSNPSTEPVEFPHPNTGVYVTGTQQANGTWQAVHTGVTKGTYAGLTGRLKNYPTVSATIAASGPVLNIQQAAPAGTGASGSGATSISITGNSSINATAYRFLSGSAQAGPFAVLVTQTSATYNHTGLTAGATVWYQMQYVGGGFYDDSPVSAAFSGTAAAAATTAPFIVLTGQSNALGVGFISDALADSRVPPLSPALLRQYANTDILFLGTTPATSTGTFAALFPPTVASGTGSTGNNMAAGDPNYTVANAVHPPSYGQEVPLSYLFNREQAAAGKLRFLKRTADGAAIATWTNGTRAAQIADFNNAVTLLPAGATAAVNLFVWIQGEANQNDTVASYQTALQGELNAYRSGGVIQAATRICLVGIRAGGNTDTAKQNIVAADTTGKTYFVSTADLPTNDGVHYTAIGHCTLGERIYNGAFATSVLLLPAVVAATAPVFSTFSPTSGAVGSSVTLGGTNFTATMTVAFGTVAATVTSRTGTTQVVATVPTGAATGTITLANGAASVTSQATFTVTVPVAAQTQAISFTGGYWAYAGQSSSGTLALAQDFAIEFRAKKGQVSSTYLIDANVQGVGSQYAILSGFVGAGIYEFFSQTTTGVRQAWPVAPDDLFHVYRVVCTAGTAQLSQDGTNTGAAFACSLNPATNVIDFNVAARSGGFFNGVVDYLKITKGGTVVYYPQFEGNLIDSSGTYPTPLNAAGATGIAYVPNT